MSQPQDNLFPSYPDDEGGDSVANAAERAVAAVEKISAGSFTNMEDAMQHAGNRLAGSLTRLQHALDGYRQSVADAASNVTAEPGLEETKLLASIEKWQRRYQEVEGERDGLKESVVELKDYIAELEKDNQSLRNLCDNQSERYEQLSRIAKHAGDRLDHSIHVIEDMMG